MLLCEHAISNGEGVSGGITNNQDPIAATGITTYYVVRVEKHVHGVDSVLLSIEVLSPISNNIFDDIIYDLRSYWLQK